MTTQTLNALDPRSSGRKESLAKEASTGKQAGRQDTGITPRWITRRKPRGVGGILQGRSRHGDCWREHG